MYSPLVFHGIVGSQPYSSKCDEFAQAEDEAEHYDGKPPMRL